MANQAADLHTSTIDQVAAAAYLAAVDLDQHVHRLCAAYRPRRDAMLAALPAATPPSTTWSDRDGGMFTWVRLPAALQHDVAFVPGVPFFVADPDRAALRLSFTIHTPKQITEGMPRLGTVLRALPHADHALS